MISFFFFRLPSKIWDPKSWKEPKVQFFFKDVLFYVKTLPEEAFFLHLGFFLISRVTQAMAILINSKR